MIFFIIMITAICFAIDQVWVYTRDGNRVNPGERQTYQDTWYEVGDFATGVSSPDASHRTLATIVSDPNIITGEVDERWGVLVFRNLSTTDGDATVYDLYTADGDGIMAFRATLTFTTGTQASAYSTYEYADTLVVTSENIAGNTKTLSPVGNNIAEYYMDAGGASDYAIVPKTITHAAKLLIRGYQ